ncbi:MAG: substrate-binding domain-containing protein, partial [Pseudomonadales bacterium]|nr:substrate-binding domain-containing protein [Pseudomonadales bacterium]
MNQIALISLRHFSTLCIALLCLMALSGACKADELYVAVAANFSSTLKKLAPLFEQQRGHRLITSTASTGQLYTQIHHGAPYEVFLSADSLRPEKLIKEGS